MIKGIHPQYPGADVQLGSDVGQNLTASTRFISAGVPPKGNGPCCLLYGDCAPIKCLTLGVCPI